MWLQTDKNCVSQRECWSLAGWVTAHPMVNAHISLFLPPCDQANFLYITPQPLRTTKGRVSDLLGMHWADTAAVLFCFILTPGLTNIPLTPSHSSSHSAGQTVPLQGDALKNCSDPCQPSLPKGHFPMLGSRSGILCPFFEFKTTSKDLCNDL